MTCSSLFFNIAISTFNLWPFAVFTYSTCPSFFLRQPQRHGTFFFTCSLLFQALSAVLNFILWSFTFFTFSVFHLFSLPEPQHHGAFLMCASPASPCSLFADLVFPLMRIECIFFPFSLLFLRWSLGSRSIVAPRQCVFFINFIFF